MRWFIWLTTSDTKWHGEVPTTEGLKRNPSACGIPTRGGEPKCYLINGEIYTSRREVKRLDQWGEIMRRNTRNGFWREIDDPRGGWVFDTEAGEEGEP